MVVCRENVRDLNALLARGVEHLGGLRGIDGGGLLGGPVDQKVRVVVLQDGDGDDVHS